jgi:hypothetical protein
MNARPDPTLYASPQLAMESPTETLAYTLMLSPDGSQPDGLAVVDVNPSSPDYGKSSTRSSRQTRVMNFIISAGMRALQPCRHSTVIRFWNGAI